MPLCFSCVRYFLALLLIIGGWTPFCDAQITSLPGIPAHTIQIPVPMGFVSATTGQLHLEIPLRSRPQRNGDPIVEKWIYDRAIGGWIAVNVRCARPHNLRHYYSGWSGHYNHIFRDLLNNDRS